MFEGLSNKATLKKARSLFEDTYAIHRPMLREIAADLDFYFGRQWDKKAKKQLEEQGRPALVFNMTQSTIQEQVGANEDAKRKARVSPVGKGPMDELQAELLNHIVDRIYADAEFEEVQREVFERGLAGAVCYSQVDATPSPEDPDEIDIGLLPISPFDALPDPTANRVGMADKGFIFLARWYTEDEFKQDFPDHWADWKMLKARFSGLNQGLPIEDENLRDAVQRAGFSERKVFESDRWFHLKRQVPELRVIHLEYRIAVRKWFARNPADGAWIPVEQKVARKIRSEEIPVEVKWVPGEQWRLLQFTGAQMLYNGEMQLPISGSSVEAFECYRDWEKGQSHSMIRKLRDPAMEVNKRISAELDSDATSGHGGLIAETGAFPDRNEAERQFHSKRDILWVNDAAIAGQRFIIRDPPQPNAQAAALTSRMVEMFIRIAGAAAPDTMDRGAQEAVGTAFLRYRRALLSITTVLANFRSYQKRTLKTVLELVVNAMPDSQIERLLGDQARFTVRNGMVADKKTEQLIPLKNLRSMRWTLELDTANENTTAQMLEFQLYLGLREAGIPVPSEVVVDSLPVPKDTREKIKAFAAAAEEQQGKEAGERTEREAAQVQGLLEIEAGKVAETTRSNLEDEEIERRKAFLQFLKGGIDSLVKAQKVGIDEAKEVRELFATLTAVADKQIERAQTPLRVGPGRVQAQ